MRLIDADALKERCKGWGDELMDGIEFEEFAESTIIPMIDEQPTIEAKRGEWEEVWKIRITGGKKYHIKVRICSVRHVETKSRSAYRFCPNCGADMRGTEHDTTTTD